MGNVERSGRGIGFTQAQQVLKDDQFEAALASLPGQVCRGPKFCDCIGQPSTLGISPGQSSSFVNENTQSVVAAQRQ